MRTAGNLLAAVAAGSLYALVFPPYALSWWAWLALTPLLALLRNDGGTPRALGLGLLFGLGFGVAAGHWMVPSLRLGFGMDGADAVVLALAVVGYSAFWFALFAALTVWMRRGRLPELLAGPAAWVACEFGRARLADGLPWLQLGHSQADTLWILQVAEVAGVPGIAFAIVLVNVLWLRAFAGWWDASADAASYATRAAAWAVAVPLAMAGLGAWRVHVLESETAHRMLRVALVQAAIPQSERWVEAFRERNMERQLELTRQAVADGAELVLWSETSVDLVPEDPAALRRSLAAALGNDPDRQIAVGLSRRLRPRRGLGDTPPHAYANSVLLVDGSGEERGVYDKIRLFSIAEQDPTLLLLLPGVARLLAPMLEGTPYLAGTSAAPLETGWCRLGVLICYEAIYPHLTRETVAQGADVLVNLTNDAFFSTPGAREQHRVQGVFRAVESRRPLVRVANSGVGTVVLASGRTALRVEPDEVRAAVVDLAPRSRGTIYLAFGYALPGLCIALCAFGLAPRLAPNREGAP